jgi:TetR/AcrR family transcriptional regulator, transcriptional repressor for nem operon
MEETKVRHNSKTKLLEAARDSIRAKGYTATRVEDVCAAAGVTKGSFFHHFNTKEDLALAVTEHWRVNSGELFASAPYQKVSDPLDRLLAYVDFRKELLQGELVDFTCLVGTLVQEVYETHPEIRDACELSISEHAGTLEPVIAEAIAKYRIDAEWTARSLALYTQAVIQGAFVLAKAKGDAEVAVACLDHLRRYVELLFKPPSKKEDTSCQPQLQSQL